MATEYVAAHHFADSVGYANCPKMRPITTSGESPVATFQSGHPGGSCCTGGVSFARLSERSPSRTGAVAARRWADKHQTGYLEIDDGAAVAT